MDAIDFKEKALALIQRERFKSLLTRPAFDDTPAGVYLQSRGLSVDDLECYDFEGTFNYQNKDYQIPQSIVVPLRNGKELVGVWIRFLEDKRFFIWMVPGKQKMWLDIRASEEPVFIAESIFDAVSLRKLFGFQNIGACLGVAVSSELESAIAIPSQDATTRETVLCFDNDRAGLKGMLNELNSNPTYSIISIEANEFKDFNDMLKSGVTPTYKILKSIQAKIYIKSKL